MIKAISLLLVLLVSTTALTLPSPSYYQSCPRECQCRGFIPWLCTYCKDINANLNDDCSTCKTGYSKNSDGLCVQNNPTCPDYCVCAGFVPWTCTRCKDPKLTLQSKCKVCQAGYVWSPLSSSCLSLSICPENCKCNGINPSECVSCLRKNFDPTTNCTQCSTGYYQTNSSYGSAWSGYPECLVQSPFPIPPGGITPQSIPPAGTDFDKIKSYVLEQHPELAGAQVTKLQTQVVAGINYLITYETATTIYNVVVWVKAWENFIQITSFTRSPKISSIPIIGGVGSVPIQITGGVSPKDPTTLPSKIKDLVIQQHPELAGATVTKLSSQVVSGIKYYITFETATTIYNVEVWSQEWVNFLEITSFTTSPKPSPVPPILGGISPQDPKTLPTKIKDYVVQKHPELANATITKVQSQVVAGLKYYITYETSTTIYNVEVWSKQWENFLQITSFTTSPKPSPIPPGGINPTDPTALPAKIKEFVLREHPQLAGATITKVATQVVAGFKYYITYETATKIYTVEVWSKSWENFLQITSFTMNVK